MIYFEFSVSDNVVYTLIYLSCFHFHSDNKNTYSILSFNSEHKGNLPRKLCFKIYYCKMRSNLLIIKTTSSSKPIGSHLIYVIQSPLFNHYHGILTFLRACFRAAHIRASVYTLNRNFLDYFQVSFCPCSLRNSYYNKCLSLHLLRFLWL